MHLLAFLLPLAIFLHFSLVGKAAMGAIRFPGSSLRSWLISPTLGFSLQILIVSIINQAGWPVEKFGRWEAIITTIIAVLLLGWKRPSFNLRLLIPFIISSLIVLAYAGWPLLKLGLGWLSYCNDDMANYCLAAIRHLHHGFFSVPTIEELSGTDYSQYYWFMHVGSFMRYGSEVLLSWVAGVTGLNPLKIFMPTIIALGMTILPATAALARAGKARYKVMVVSTLLLAFSPLFLLGMFYQLIAQVAGIAFLCTISTLFMGERAPKSWSSLMRLALVAGTVGAAFSITYPELSPFFALGFLLWIIVMSWRSLSIFWMPVLLILLSGGIALVWLRYNVLVYLMTILAQSQSGTHSLGSDVLYPYFLVPSGLPVLFGLLPVAGLFTNIQGYIVMAFAVGLLILSVILVIHSVKRGKGHACIAAIMLLMGAWLFYNKIGFGTFKLAMFIQPFIAIELALFLCGLGISHLLIILSIYCLMQFPAGSLYGIASLGKVHVQFTEVPTASTRNLEITKNGKGSAISLESAHMVIEKFAACQQEKGETLILNKRYVFEKIASINDIAKSSFIIHLTTLLHPHASEILKASCLTKKLQSIFQEREILGTKIKNLEYQEKKDIKIYPPQGIEIFNGLVTRQERENVFFQSRCIRPKELFLTFVHSDKGEHYYNCLNRKVISFYQNQKDLYSLNQSMAGIGSYFLFQVDDSLEQDIYLRVAVTKSILGNDRTALYQHAEAKGIKAQHADFIGNGAANLYIGPVKPVKLDGISYVALDFGEEGERPAKNKDGIMGLYRKEQSIDPRYLTAYARDISAITSNQYKAIKRPREIKNFPKDLAEATTLEFSGWYEDGWISQHSYAVLGAIKQGAHLVVKGMIPEFGKIVTKGQGITVLVNGDKIYTQQNMKPGNFELNLTLSPEKQKSNALRIELVFKNEEKLSAPDFRPVAAKITYLGFK